MNENPSLPVIVHKKPVVFWAQYQIKGGVGNFPSSNSRGIVSSILGGDSSSKLGGT